MKPSRSSLEAAAGKLISAVQREWGLELGDPAAAQSEEVMHACHDLLLAAKRGSLAPVLGSKTISQFLGVEWVASHPSIATAICALESAANQRNIDAASASSPS
jgi:hypothetical protein